MKTQKLNTSHPAYRPNRDQLSDFIRSQALCVISSLNRSGAPEAATVAFSETKEGKLIIGTDSSSRKAQNIASDPRVAMTMTDSDKRYTVQLEGETRWLTDDEFSELSGEHYRQLPQSRPFKDQPGQVHIIITPNHIRFTDCSVHPWSITEF